MALAMLLLAFVSQAALSALPKDAVPLREVEIRLSFLGGTGGCHGRCVLYHATIRGDGSVRYEDVGPEPRDPVQRRTIPVEDVVTVVNEFLRERFLEAADEYFDGASTAIRNGDALEFPSFVSGIDGGIWELSFRAGSTAKSVTLHGQGIPSHLLRLRQLVEEIAGPKAWLPK